MDYDQIPAEHISRLKAISGQDPNPRVPLPDEIIHAYYRMAEAISRIGTMIGDRELLMVFMTAGLDYGVTSKPKTVIQLWDEGMLRPRDVVQVKWRRQWRKASLVSVSGDRIFVTLLSSGSDDTEDLTIERELDASQCIPLGRTEEEMAGDQQRTRRTRRKKTEPVPPDEQPTEGDA